MKKNTIFLTILIVTLVLWGCKGKTGSGQKEENFDKDASYALGMSMGTFIIERFSADEIVPNQKQFLLGIKDTLSGGKIRLSAEEADKKIEEAINVIIDKRYNEYMKENDLGSILENDSEYMQEGIDFLVENGKKPGIKTTSSGLQYEVLKEGNGKKPSADDMVRVHYEGKLINGTVFDSSYDREPAEFPLNGVISGWTEGLQLMNTGGKYRLFIPSELAYGVKGRGPIPPNSVLIFEVELLDIIN